MPNYLAYQKWDGRQRISYPLCLKGGRNHPFFFCCIFHIRVLDYDAAWQCVLNMVNSQFVLQYEPGLVLPGLIAAEWFYPEVPESYTSMFSFYHNLEVVMASPDIHIRCGILFP